MAKKAGAKSSRKASRKAAPRRPRTGHRRLRSDSLPAQQRRPETAGPAPAQLSGDSQPETNRRGAEGAVSPSGLSPKDIEMFRQMLLEKRAQLVGDVSKLRDEALSKSRQDASGDLSSMPLHMADLGTDNYEQEFTLGLIEDERALLREIDEALERIAKGTYGICLGTGKPIGKARLKAQPWAKYSYEYALAREKGQRR